MPKVSKEKTGAKQISKLIALKHGQKRVMVNRQKSYNLMLDIACKHFPSIPKDAVTLQTNQLDICEGHYMDITAETWDNVIDLITSIEVTRTETPLPIPLPSNAGDVSLPDTRSELPEVNGYQDSLYAPQSASVLTELRLHSSKNDRVMVRMASTSDEILFVSVKRATQVQKLLDLAARRLGECYALCDGRRMDRNRSIGSYDLEDDGYIYVDFMTDQVGGKPVIYLYSPSDVDVSVKLSLSPEWSFSAIYPVVSPKQDNGQHIEWNVRTHQDGILTENNTGLDVSYLFWEAKTNSDAFPRSPASKPQSVDVFSPTSSTLGDMDSIVISVDKVTSYLDKSLKVLGLHTEARTSFITYWLPSILKHEYIALRFVPQSAYERAASLSISPQPDVVTRVFMLFRGICKEQLADWSKAQAQAEKDVAWWADVVGVDLARASDLALFRVLEWGGMEVDIHI